MVIGDRLRALREQKGLTQSEIEKRSGLLRCYLSRIENGHIVPSIETVERLARALGEPLSRLFNDAGEVPALPNLPQRTTADQVAQSGTPERNHFLDRLSQLLGRLSEDDRRLLLNTAQRLGARKTSGA